MSVFGKMSRSFARTVGLSNRKRFTNKNSLRALKNKTMNNKLIIPQVSTRNISCKRILPHLDDADLHLDNEVKDNIRKLCKYKRDHPGRPGYKGLKHMTTNSAQSITNKKAEELVAKIENYVRLKKNSSSKKSITEKELSNRLEMLHFGPNGKPTEANLRARLNKLHYGPNGKPTEANLKARLNKLKRP